MLYPFAQVDCNSEYYPSGNANTLAGLMENRRALPFWMPFCEGGAAFIGLSAIRNSQRVLFDDY